MPCKGGPDQDEIEYHKEYESNPIFKKHIDSLRELYDIQCDRYYKLLEKLTYKRSLVETEDIAFNSFMTVFLCKAMDIIGSNNLMQHTYPDMEWWYKEHKTRDANNDKSLMKRSDLNIKLKFIEDKYKIK